MNATWNRYTYTHTLTHKNESKKRKKIIKIQKTKRIKSFCMKTYNA